VIVGASLEANNHGIGGSQSSNASLSNTLRGPLILGNALAGSPLWMPAAFERTLIAGVGPDLPAFLRRGSNMGYGSRTMKTIDNVVRNRVSVTPAGVVLISPGRNWVGNTDTSIAEQQALYAADCALMRSQGRTVIHMGLAMRTAWTEGDSNWNANLAMDQWLRTFAAAYGEAYFDVAAAIHLEGAPNPYTHDPAVYVDGTHYNTVGGERVALAFKAFLEGLFTPWPDITNRVTNFDTASAGYNRISNPYLEDQGPNGTKVGSNITAETIVPTGFTLYGPSAEATVAGAFITRNGKPAYELTITPTGVAGSATVRLLQNVSSPSWGEFGVTEEVTEWSAALLGISPRVELSASPTVLTSIATRDSGAPPVSGTFRRRSRGMVKRAVSGDPISSTSIMITIDTGVATPFKVVLNEWFWWSVDFGTMFPDSSVIRQSDTSESPS